MEPTTSELAAPPAPIKRRKATQAVVAAATAMVQDPGDPTTQLWRAVGAIEAKQETQGSRLNHLEDSLREFRAEFSEFKKETRGALHELTSVVIPFVQAAKRLQEEAHQTQDRLSRKVSAALPLLGALIVFFLTGSANRTDGLSLQNYHIILVITCCGAAVLYLWAINKSVPRTRPDPPPPTTFTSP